MNSTKSIFKQKRVSSNIVQYEDNNSRNALNFLDCVRCSPRFLSPFLNSFSEVSKYDNYHYWYLSLWWFPEQWMPFVSMFVEIFLSSCQIFTLVKKIIHGKCRYEKSEFWPLKKSKTRPYSVQESKKSFYAILRTICGK